MRLIFDEKVFFTQKKIISSSVTRKKLFSTKDTYFYVEKDERNMLFPDENVLHTEIMLFIRFCLDFRLIFAIKRQKKMLILHKKDSLPVKDGRITTKCRIFKI